MEMLSLGAIIYGTSCFLIAVCGLTLITLIGVFDLSMSNVLKLSELFSHTLPIFRILGSPTAKPIQLLLRTVRKYGKICIFGAPERDKKAELDFSSHFINEVDIITSYSASLQAI